MNVKRKAPNCVHCKKVVKRRRKQWNKSAARAHLLKEGSSCDIQGTVLESFSNARGVFTHKMAQLTLVILWLSSRLKLFRIRPSQPFLYIPSAPAVERYSLKFQRQPRFDKLTRNVLGRVLGFVLLASRIPTSNTHKYKYIESQIQAHWSTNTSL